MRLAPHRGMTFVELMISAALIFILMTMCFTLFTSSWRRFHAMNVMQEVHNNATFGMERLGKDLRETTSKNLYFVNDDYICFPSARENNGEYRRAGNQPVWKYWVIYYRISDGSANDRRILKKRIDVTINPGPGAQNLKNNVAGAQVVAREVYFFGIESAPASGTLRSYRITIATKADYQGKDYSFAVKKIIPLRDL